MDLTSPDFKARAVDKLGDVKLRRALGMLQERFEKTDVQHLSRREASSFLSELLGANGG